MTASFSAFSIDLCKRCGDKLEWKRKEPGSMSVLSQLRNNYLLTNINGTEATQSILSTLREIAPDIDRYEKEIERISGLLAELKHEYAQLKRFSDEYRALVAPVRKLPAELLSEVLAFHCSALSNKIGEDSPTPAIEFSQTCSFWRMVALSQSRFWSKLCVDVAAPIEKLGWINELLRRSGNYPLTLAIHSSPENSSVHSPHCVSYAPTENRFLSMILSHSDRWAEVRVRDPLNFGPFSTKSYPMLEYLEVQAPDRLSAHAGMQWSFLTTIPGPLPRSVTMPKLHTLTMSDKGNINRHQVLATLACLPSLESLTIEGLGVASALSVMETKLPRRLSHISFKIDNTNFFSTNDPVRTIRTDIPSLSVCFDVEEGTQHWPSRDRDVAIFFRHLDAPQLTSLDISIAFPSSLKLEDSVGMWPHTSFLKALSRCSPCLQSLSLSGITICLEDIPELLEALPVLTRLSVTQWPVKNGPSMLLLFLSLSVQQRLLLPQLTELILEVSGRESLEGEMVAKMIRSRSRSSDAVTNGRAARLEKLVVRVSVGERDAPVFWNTTVLDGTVLEIGYEG
ncbi:hypothetical protein D9757_007424 [Collybiopsis confluens]|uniref:F-box domain-containing protein n=1 Tax=Collybiopsis confluens TaxID=2823264 RepID=A0A8H5M7N8_9AGAR|nr:hypothetical protein D9757_007424 [Collybiopsis confluens]